jgi:chromosome segregation ATPase
MRIDIHHHHHDAPEVLRALRHINDRLEMIMATQTELIETLRLVNEQQKKTVEEIRTLQGSVDTLNERIAELEALIAAGEVSQELTDAVQAVKDQAQIVDDQIPDVPSP